MKFLLMLTAAVAVVACSNQAVYQNLQHDRRIECSQLPESEYEECMQGLDQPYEQYEAQRREVLDE